MLFGGCATPQAAGESSLRYVCVEGRGDGGYRSGFVGLRVLELRYDDDHFASMCRLAPPTLLTQRYDLNFNVRY